MIHWKKLHNDQTVDVGQAVKTNDFLFPADAHALAVFRDSYLQNVDDRFDNRLENVCGKVLAVIGVGAASEVALVLHDDGMQCYYWLSELLVVEDNQTLEQKNEDVLALTEKYEAAKTSAAEAYNALKTKEKEVLEESYTESISISTDGGDCNEGVNPKHRQAWRVGNNRYVRVFSDLNEPYYLNFTDGKIILLEEDMMVLEGVSATATDVEIIFHD